MHALLLARTPVESVLFVRPAYRAFLLSLDPGIIDAKFEIAKGVLVAAVVHAPVARQLSLFPGEAFDIR